MKRVATPDQVCDEELAASILASLGQTSALPALEAFTVAPKDSLEPKEPPKKSARHFGATRHSQQASSPRCQVAPTRSYTWRGPHRLALKQKQEAAKLLQEQACFSDADRSSRRSSASSGHSDDDDAAPQQQQQQLDGSPAAEPSSRQRDKEWAALTTWLRMNLSNPRTAKKLVLFVGEHDAATGTWRFTLNPGLSWADLSLETKLRLKMLPLEAEQAFHHKYPHRPAHEWRSKAQKYRPKGAAAPVNVALSDVVLSLNSIYYQHEGGAADSSSSQPALTQPQHHRQHPASSCPDGQPLGAPRQLALAPALVQQQTRLAEAAEGLVSPRQAPATPAIQAC